MILNPSVPKCVCPVKHIFIYILFVAFPFPRLSLSPGFLFICSCFVFRCDTRLGGPWYAICTWKDRALSYDNHHSVVSKIGRCVSWTLAHFRANQEMYNISFLLWPSHFYTCFWNANAMCIVLVSYFIIYRFHLNKLQTKQNTTKIMKKYINIQRKISNEIEIDPTDLNKWKKKNTVPTATDDHDDEERNKMDMKSAEKQTCRNRTAPQHLTLYSIWSRLPLTHTHWPRCICCCSCRCCTE